METTEKMLVVMWVLCIILSFRLYAIMTEGDEDPRGWFILRVIFWLTFIATAFWLVTN